LSARRASTIESIVKAAGRCIGVIIAILSWIAISNHCSLGAFASAAKPQMIPGECPFHSKPAKSKEQPAGMQCCKILRAVVAKLANNWARDDGKFSDVDLRIEKSALTAHLLTTPPPLLLDTGPPSIGTFAELILQRSLLAHAPPSRT
jgi:hypothetical protein